MSDERKNTPGKPSARKGKAVSKAVSSRPGTNVSSPQKNAVSLQHSKNHSAFHHRSPKKRLTKKRLVINVIAILSGILLLLGGVACIMVYICFHRINFQEINTDDPAQTGQASTGTDSQEVSHNNWLNDPMVLNIMLFGEDTRSGITTGNSDTMVLLSIDTRHQKLKMLSFMRDTYVTIPGYGENRINAAYTIGGAALAVSTIQKNYGIRIDRYIVVDFGCFKKIMDVLGGLDVELTEEEVDYINWQIWINDQPDYYEAKGDYKETIREQLKYTWYDIPENEKPINKDTLLFKDNGDDAPTAAVHLDGTQILWHARNRGEDGICNGDDFTRTQRQRDILRRITEHLKKCSLTTLFRMMYEIAPFITTNIRTSEIMDLALKMTTYLTYPIISQAAPAVNAIGSDFYFSDEEHPVYINGIFSSVILIADWDSFRQQIAEFLYEEQALS